MRRTRDALRVRPVGVAALGALVGVLALAMLAGAGAGSTATGGEITPGKGVGPITIGLALSDLLRLWGAPEGTGRDPDGVDVYDYSEARGVRVFLKGDRVARLLVVTPAWSTPNGIKVGTTRPEVRAFYGQPDETLSGQTPDEARYWYKQRGIVVILRDRTVAALEVLAAETGPRGSPADRPRKGRGRGVGGS